MDAKHDEVKKAEREDARKRKQNDFEKFLTPHPYYKTLKEYDLVDQPAPSGLALIDYDNNSPEREKFRELIDKNSNSPLKNEVQRIVVDNMSRFVRVSMFTLLNFLASPRGPYDPPDAGNEGTMVTMGEIVAYIDCFPVTVRKRMRICVEEIFNRNGLSLQIEGAQKYRPGDLAGLFAPIVEPSPCEDSHSSH